ncbi:MAG TPA: hypothetical protein VMB52_05560 [Verrucomicrobiae bacterium]|nr:hypothetical protein [Verrucomicrobiae bacterium]
MNKLRPQAEELRRQGYSYALIQEKLGVPRSTMHYWFKDMPFTPNPEVIKRMKIGPEKVGERRHIQRLGAIERLKQLGIMEIGELSRRDLFMLGLGFYIGEGAKTTETIRIVNSDPSAVRLAVRWLKEVCQLKEENLTVSLHLYPDNDIQLCKDYWRDITGLPAQSFRWVSIDRRQDKRRLHKGKLPFGTAHITVRANGDHEKGVSLFRRINGWMQGALNQV